MELVSIIIPTYNSSKHIEECLISALSQTWKNKEIILVDDGSEDNTLEIVTRYEQIGLTILKQMHKGASAARNRGLSYATGDFIQFLDSDDIISINKIESQIIELNGRKDKLAVCSTVHFNDGTNFINAKPSAYEDSFLTSTDKPLDFLINLWGGNGNGASMVQTNAWLVPAELIKKNDPWKEFYSPDDDGEYFSRIIISSNGIIYTNQCLNYYRKLTSTNNLSTKYNEKALYGCFKSILCKKENLSKYLFNDKVRRGIANQLIGIAIKTYPQYNSLYSQIDLEIKKLNIKYDIPEIGGKTINAISKIFGWKFARLLQCCYQNRLT